jgi:hypothetical protein
MLKRCKAAIKGSRFQDGTKVLKPFAKRAAVSAPESVSGRVLAPDLGCPAPEAVGVSTATFSAFVEHSSSIPSVVSAPEVVSKKSSFSSEDSMTLGSASSGSTSPVAGFSFPPVASSRLEGISSVVLGSAPGSSYQIWWDTSSSFFFRGGWVREEVAFIFSSCADGF